MMTNKGMTAEQDACIKQAGRWLDILVKDLRTLADQLENDGLELRSDGPDYHVNVAASIANRYIRETGTIGITLQAVVTNAAEADRQARIKHLGEV